MMITDPPSGRKTPPDPDVPPSDGLLTSNEAARYLRVSIRWLQAATAAGHIPCVRLAHPGAQRGPVRYRKEDLDAYVTRCQCNQRHAGGDK